MGLRVVKISSGEPASFWDSIDRNMCDLWVGCCPVILFITKGRRRFGDLIAETIVIKDK